MENGKEIITNKGLIEKKKYFTRININYIYIYIFGTKVC